MSWFSELTSKAEAMLVKLDNNAAQALQNQDTILQRTKLIDKTISSSSNIGYDELRDIQEPSEGQNRDSDQQIADQTDQDLISVEISGSSDASKVQNIDQSANRQRLVSSDEIFPKTTLNDQIANYPVGSVRDAIEVQDERQQKESLVSVMNHSSQSKESPSTRRKFKLQTSTLRQPLLDKQKATRGSHSVNHVNGHTKANKNGETILGADDIRASINRSLQEYSASASSRSQRYQATNEQTMYTSHFDDQPNLIDSSSSLDERRSNDRLHSSPSFSIDFPETKTTSSPSTDIAERILRQSALKKKSAFNLHKVINKLAGNSDNNGQSQAILSDKTKVRLRRAQMRLAGYLRRLNYYFRIYPTMKYWMLGYLVILQLLVVYVLFFYQSSGSSSYLTSQVKQQQENLVEMVEESLKSNSENIKPQLADDLRSNNFA